VSWQDAGRLFNEIAELFDPVQGAVVANCHFIAALSAIAWATPYRITQQTRVTGLGWAYRDCTRYILLRNLWGSAEASVGALDATVHAYDVSWSRPIALKDAADGTFAMEISTFKKYYAGLGVVV
jgi:hypothetical protein